MFRNYFVIAVRSLWRNKLITSINIVGMALGFGIFICFWSWIRFDLSYDKFHRDIDRIYNLKIKVMMNGSEYTADRTGGAFAKDLVENFPGITKSCRVSEPLEFELGVRVDEGQPATEMKYINDDRVLAVDSSFLRFFTFRLAEGDIRSIFSERDHIVLTESLVMKLFGKEDPMGREIRIGEGNYYHVVGVAEDPPKNSSIQFDALLEFHKMEELGYETDGYGGTMFYNFFKVSETENLKKLDEDINAFVEPRMGKELDAYFFLDPLKRLHLYGESKNYIGLYANLIMSIVIMLIACINFVNLSTAYSSGRLKEIAIRKAAGASRRQLTAQFLGETYLLLLIALYLGLFLAEHLLPYAGRIFGLSVSGIPKELSFWLQVLTIYLVTGFLAGIYPALHISGLKAPAFLHSKYQDQFSGGKKSRMVLVVLQFTFSIIFIVITVFTSRQFDYLKDADIGFNRNDVIYIRTRGKAWENYQLIRNDLMQLPFIRDVATGSEIPVFINRGDINWGERDGEHNQLARILFVDQDFLSTLDIDLVEGEFFSDLSDSVNEDYVVVNRSLADQMGWENPVGRDFFMWGRDLRIIGVIDNIKFFPFNLEAVAGQALILRYGRVNDFIFVRADPGITSHQISSIQSVFERYNPGYEFTYNFVRDFKYDAMENSDGIKFLFKLFSVLGIFISVIGLIGLSVYSSNRRRKEVGIRKAMGAQSRLIIRLLLSDFLKLVILSNLIALPLSFLIIRKILMFFSYRVAITSTVFIGVFLLSVILSLITVLTNAIRTARSNPVNSLRYE